MALFLFILTMLCIYIRPFSLPLWAYSICGAAACLSFGIVGWGDAWRVWTMVWDSTFTLIGLIVLSIVLEKLGFFEFLAQRILHFLARSSKNKAENTESNPKKLPLKNGADSNIKSHADKNLFSTAQTNSRVAVYDDCRDYIDSCIESSAKSSLSEPTKQNERVDSCRAVETKNHAFQAGSKQNYLTNSKQESAESVMYHSNKAHLGTHNPEQTQAIYDYNCKNKAQNTTHLSIPAARFYIFIVLFGSILATLFANDGAILVLTPLIFALFSHAKNSYIKASQDFHTKDSRAKDSHIKNSCAQQSFFTPLIIFLLLVGFVSDFASNTLAISNLTNIITLHFFNLDALRFSAFMTLPQIFIIIVCLLFWLFVRRFLPQNLVFENLDSKAKKIESKQAQSSAAAICDDFVGYQGGGEGSLLGANDQADNADSHKSAQMATRNTIIFCFGIIALLLCGIFIANAFALPLCLFTLACAALSLVYARVQSRGKIALLSCLKAAPFGIVSFSLGLFIVVYGLQSSLPQLRDIFGFILHELPESSHIFSVGLLSSLGSSVINNLPMTMLGDLSLVASGLSSALGSMLDSVPHSGELFADMNETLIYAHLLGCNVGAKLTPIGSLATLLWLESLKRYGVHIGFLRYTLVAFIVVFPALCAGLLGLMIARQIV